MEIHTPKDVMNPVFDDFLEPLPSEKTWRGQLTRARLGRPEWWFATDIFGEEWKSPRSGDNYLMVRLSCSLEPAEGQEIQDTTLKVNLYCRDATHLPVAFDLFPREIKEEAQTDLTLSLGPELKFGVVDGSLGSVGATIHIPKVEPVVITTGIGDADPAWIFRRHRKYPLEGNRLVYLVVAVPKEARELRLNLNLIATVADRFGFIRLAVPEKARSRLSWVIS